MATLYRCRTPTNWLCPCGRVARELRRSGIEAEVVRVPWRGRDRAEVQTLSGQDRVPLLVLGGEAICDSHRIVEHLGWLRERATQAGPATGEAPAGPDPQPLWRGTAEGAQPGAPNGR